MNTLSPKTKFDREIELRRDARYADKLVEIAQELRDTADMIAGIEAESARIHELRMSRDWREDEIKFLSQLVADVRMRIGAY